jgi:hypothetical protein
MDAKSSDAVNTSEKRKKFQALAESRTNKALDAIGRIGNLSNRTLYEWDESEVRKILKALRDSVAEIEGRFASPKGKASPKFKL